MESEQYDFLAATCRVRNHFTIETTHHRLNSEYISIFLSSFINAFIVPRAARIQIILSLIFVGKTISSQTSRLRCWQSKVSSSQRYLTPLFFVSFFRHRIDDLENLVMKNYIYGQRVVTCSHFEEKIFESLDETDRCWHWNLILAVHVRRKEVKQK